MLRALILAWALVCVAPVHAQQGLQSPILTIDSDRLFFDSAFGKRVMAEIDAREEVLAAENRTLQAELEAEEQELTALRPTMAPEEFRALADAFDARVQTIRRQREAENQVFGAMLEDGQRRFLQVAAPVLEQIVRDVGAAVIIDQRFVFLSVNAVDITQRAIAEIDATLGDGTDP